MVRALVTSKVMKIRSRGGGGIFMLSTHSNAVGGFGEVPWCDLRDILAMGLLKS